MNNNSNNNNFNFFESLILTEVQKLFKYLTYYKLKNIGYKLVFNNNDKHNLLTRLKNRLGIDIYYFNRLLTNAINSIIEQLILTNKIKKKSMILVKINIPNISNILNSSKEDFEFIIKEENKSYIQLLFLVIPNEKIIRFSTILNNKAKTHDIDYVINI